MRNELLRLIVAGFLCVLSGCGGGGGDGHSISVTPNKLQFITPTGSVSSPQRVAVSFKGDGVVVGYPPGQPEPSWLIVNTVDASTDTAHFDLIADARYIDAGSYHAVVRFVTGNIDGSGLKYKDVAVTLESKQGLALSAYYASFSQIYGAPETLPSTVDIAVRGDGVQWQASTDQPWLAIKGASGGAGGQFQLSVQPNVIKSVGHYSADVIVKDTVSGHIETVHVGYGLTAPQLNVDTQPIQFSVEPSTPESAISHTLVMADNLGGAPLDTAVHWTATTSAPWLKLSLSGGDTASTDLLALTLDKSAIRAFGNGSNTTQIVISAVDMSGTVHVETIPVTLNVRLPSARSAMPYLVEPGSAGTFVLRGDGIQPSDIASLRIGSSEPTNVEFVDSTLLQVSYPALAQGSHKIYFNNALHIDRSVATINAGTAIVPGAGLLNSPGAKRKLIYDPLRGTLYAVNYHGTLERFRWTGEIWTAETPLTVDGLTDIVLSRTGNELLILSEHALYSMSLSDSNAAVQALVTLSDDPYSSCDPGFNYIAVLDTAKVMISKINHRCSSNDGFFTYDPLQNRSEGSGYFFTMPRVAASADGRIAAVGQNGSSGGDFGIFSSSPFGALNIFGYGHYGMYDYYAIDVSANGDRILANNTVLRNRDGTDLGKLPDNRVAKLSPDGKRAYAYVHEAIGAAKIDVYSLTLPASDFYLRQDTVAVDQTLGDPEDDLYYDFADPNMAMTITSDEKTLIVSGTQKIQIIPLP